MVAAANYYPCLECAAPMHPTPDRQRLECEKCHATVGSGVGALQGENAVLVDRVRTVLLKRAADARHDVTAFFEFVMEEEVSRRPIACLPHQRLALDFIMAHDRTVNMWPVGTSKSFLTIALTLFFLGQDVTTRGAIVSAAGEQAEKILLAVRSYIEESWKLALVFPHLKRSTRKGDPWTQSALTIERPAGIRDPSLVAVGQDSKRIVGSRWNWIVVDDILNDENTATKEAREKLYTWFGNSVLSRLDPETVGPTRVVVTNTPWHIEDLLNTLMKVGWATMRMDIYGTIFIQDDVERVRPSDQGGLGLEPWDSRYMRPSSPSNYSDPSVRLVAHDPDLRNEVPLWPDRYPLAWIEKKRRSTHPIVFNQTLLCICRDDATAMCKLAWIEACKAKARQRGIHDFTSKPTSDTQLVFTGVDLAVGLGEEHDDTCLFTFEVLPDHHRRILDIEVGKFDGPTIRDKIIAKTKQYNSVVRVENVAAQEYILAMVREKDVSIPMKPHKTTAESKASLIYGLPALFTEIFNVAWLIPNDKWGNCPPAVQRWVDACLNYLPTKHPDDTLMASHFAHAQAREWGVLTGEAIDILGDSNIGAAIMAR
jgi:hypothetical protein